MHLVILRLQTYFPLTTSRIAFSWFIYFINIPWAVLSCWNWRAIFLTPALLHLGSSGKHIFHWPHRLPCRNRISWIHEIPWHFMEFHGISWNSSCWNFNEIFYETFSWKKKHPVKASFMKFHEISWIHEIRFRQGILKVIDIFYQYSMVRFVLLAANFLDTCVMRSPAIAHICPARHGPASKTPPYISLTRGAHITGKGGGGKFGPLYESLPNLAFWENLYTFWSEFSEQGDLMFHT
jgi:hypothetical protein